MEQLNFKGKRTCDFCGQEEICANTHYGTTNYTRVICLECAMSVNQNDFTLTGKYPFDLNNSRIFFK